MFLGLRDRNDRSRFNLGLSARRPCRARGVARGGGEGVRKLHALLQGDRGQGLQQEAGRVVYALHQRQRLRHLRDAADRLPHLLLRMDAGEGPRPGVEARALQVRAGDGRGRPSHRVRRSGRALGLAQGAVFHGIQAPRCARPERITAAHHHGADRRARDRDPARSRDRCRRDRAGRIVASCARTGRHYRGAQRSRACRADLRRVMRPLARLSARSYTAANQREEPMGCCIIKNMLVFALLAIAASD